MLIEKLLSFAFSLPLLSKLTFSTAHIEYLITVLSSLGFVSNFVDIPTAITCSLVVIVASFVSGIVKIVISIIP